MDDLDKIGIQYIREASIAIREASSGLEIAVKQDREKTIKIKELQQENLLLKIHITELEKQIKQYQTSYDRFR